MDQQILANQQPLTNDTNILENTSMSLKEPCTTIQSPIKSSISVNTKSKLVEHISTGSISVLVSTSALFNYSYLRE